MPSKAATGLRHDAFMRSRPTNAPTRLRADRRHAARYSTFALVFAVSCGGAEEHTVSNQGWLCVGKLSAQTSAACPLISLEQQLPINVDFGICLSSSCDHAGETSCRATRSGSIIQVTADGTWSRTGENGCTFDCRHLTATCQTDVLPDGDYEIRYADTSLAVTIPSLRSRNCMPAAGVLDNCCDADADCAPGRTCDTSQHTCNNPLPGE